MTTRSLKFQLIVWYACVLTGCFALLGGATYASLKRSLVGALKENQLRRARLISQLVNEEFARGGLDRIKQEIEDRYAPASNDRFVRVTRRDGSTLYLSPPPKSLGFDPAAITPPAWPTKPESFQQVPLPAGRKILLVAHLLEGPNGQHCLIEAGAPMDDVQAGLRKWLVFLGVMLPVVLAVALGGGLVLVKRALLPVDKISASAERISSHNLSERLPVTQTGDELERLSLALNHMIERLDSAFEHSRRFVADASHELRTPLTVLKGELEEAVQEHSLSADWRNRLGSALEEVNRLANIVEGLFAISRLDAGEAAAEWVKFDLAQLAVSTADQMSLLAEDKKISFKCPSQAPVWVEGDRSRMKQVVVNLLDNAIKYTPEGGTVTLAVTTQNEKAVLEIADTGIGIPDQALSRVFERFFRVDKARSRDDGGAGLGLSIVKSICTAHHGRVEAHSIPGKGSTFYVELPVTTPPTNHFQKQKNHAK